MLVSGDLPLGWAGILNTAVLWNGKFRWRRRLQDFYLWWSIERGTYFYSEEFYYPPTEFYNGYAPRDGTGPTGIFWPAVMHLTGEPDPELETEYSHSRRYGNRPVYTSPNELWHLWLDAGDNHYYLTDAAIHTHNPDEDWWKAVDPLVPWSTYQAGGTASGPVQIAQMGATGVPTITRVI